MSGSDASSRGTEEGAPAAPGDLPDRDLGRDPDRDDDRDPDRDEEQRRGWRALGRIQLGVLAAVFAVALVMGPSAVVLGGIRLVVLAILGVGAWVTLGRVGLVDLATGAAAGAGAYAGGVLSAVVGLPAAVGLVTGGLAGAAVGAVSGAVAGRVGRTLGALTSLAVGAAVVAVLRVWPGAGGAAGFYAVPLLTPGDRGDLLLLLGVLLVVVIVAWRYGRSGAAAVAALAAAAPHVAASLGRRPALATAYGGLVGGAVLGIGGAAGAAASGAVVPAAYGLPLSAALALAVLVGGRTPLAGVVGAVFVWGPSVVWPGLPVIGDASPLLVMGVAGIVLLALRPDGILAGRLGPAPVRASVAASVAASAAASVAASVGSSVAPSVGEGVAAHRWRAPGPRVGERTLSLIRLPLVAGGSLDLEVRPGELVALTGPNGAGKSTLLANVAGQLGDKGSIDLDDRALPRGAAARARAGIARTWQQPPDVGARDALVVATKGRGGAAGAAWASEVLGTYANAPAGAQLVRLAAMRPAVALLDEPAAALPPDVVARFVRGLASAGVAVLMVEHRPELVAIADRVVRIGGRR